MEQIKMSKNYLASIKNIWTSILMPFSFIIKFFHEILLNIKEDIVEAACQPAFSDALSGVIRLIVKYIGIVLMTSLVVFFMFLILVLLLALIITFPYISLSIFGFFMLIVLGVKAIRKHNPEKVEAAKKKYE